MVVTNEPGFYRKDDFGIRIENCVLVQKSAEHKGFLCLEDVTLVPIQVWAKTTPTASSLCIH
eukprot:m.31474 g.31474  ORF g.31474 m.31474 type:complete len:62 (+) comp9698_c0_seq7:1739-1924(+)